MFLKENVLLAVAGLKSNRMRSFLTMLGIIIGIGSVIAIVSIGDAVTSKVSDAMSGNRRERYSGLCYAERMPKTPQRMLPSAETIWTTAT